MTNLFSNCLFHERLRKAAITIKKPLFIVMAPTALALVGALMNYATPAQLPNPGRGAAPAQDVNVANPATAPVLAVNVNDMGRIPYQSTHPITTAINDGHQFASPFPAVPAGYRLVLQHVSGQVFFDSPTPVTLTLTVLTADTELRSIFPVPNPQAFDHSVLAYYEAGENPMVILTTDPQSYSQPSKFVGITLTGYLVDCNIAPCAAIVR